MNETELERLSVRLTGDGSSYQRMLAQADQSTARFSSRIQVHTRTINAMGLQMKAYAGGAGGQIAGMLGIGGALGTASSAIGKYAQQEQTEIAFTALIGNAELAQKTLKDLYKFAADTPFESPEILAASKQMVAFGESAQNLVPTMKALGDVSAGLNIPLGQLTYLYGTLKSQGIAHTVDINQFAMRGIPIWQELEKITGKNNAQLRQMVEHGQVGFPLVQQAFENMTKEGGKFHGQLEKQSKSLMGLFSTLKDNIGMTLADIGKDISEAIDLKGMVKDAGELTAKMSELFKNLSPETKRMAVQIAAWTLGIGTVLLLLPYLKFAFLALVAPVALIFTKVGLLVAAVAAAGYVFFTMTETGAQTLKYLGSQIDALKEHFKGMTDGVRAALSAGDLELAFKIVVKQMEVEWARFNVGFVKYWNATKDVFLDDSADMATSFAQKWLSALGYVRKEWKLFFIVAMDSMEMMFRAMGDKDAANAIQAAGQLNVKQFDQLVETSKKATDRMEKDRKAAARAGRDEDLKDAEENLKKLEGEAAKLQLFAKVKDAFRKANIFKDALGGAAKEAEAMAPVALKIVPKFDHAAWGGADAQARIQEFRDLMGLETLGAKLKGPGGMYNGQRVDMNSPAFTGGAGGNLTPGMNQSSTPEPLPRGEGYVTPYEREMLDLMADIARGIGMRRNIAAAAGVGDDIAGGEF